MNLPKGFYDGINELVSMNCQFPEPSDPGYKKIINLLRYCFIVGSTVIDDKITWQEDNDIDIYFYKPKSKHNEFNQVISLFRPLEEMFDFDLLPVFSTDSYQNASTPSKTLTDYIFNEAKSSFTEPVGMMRILNAKGFFISKLATLCLRKEDKDYYALKVVYDDFNKVIPNDVLKVISDYSMQSCLDMFLEKYSKEKL